MSRVPAEAMVYHATLPQITCIPRCTALDTSSKMKTDPEEVAFFTTQSQKLQPKFYPPHIKKILDVEEPLESTVKASFPPHPYCPVVKATAKHLEEGFPTIKGDRSRQSYVSHYKDTFQGAWLRADKPVKTHCSVALGDPAKIVERETTHAASFSWPAAYRQPVVKNRLKLNLEHTSENLWSSITREDFCHHKMDPVVMIKRDENFSSLPKGDIDTRRNKERMSFTTNRDSFSDLNHLDCSVYAPGTDRITKSHVQFSPPGLLNQYYSTTAKEHFGKQEGERATAAVQLPSNILSKPEYNWKPSTTKTDYIPFKARKRSPCPSQHRGSIRFPLAHQHVNTTHKEDYTTKPLTLRHPGYGPSSTQFLIN